MALAYEATGSYTFNGGGTSANTTSITVDAQCDYIAVGIATRFTEVASVSSSTLGGQAMTLVGETNVADTAGYLQVYELKAPPTGAQNLVVDFSTDRSTVVGHHQLSGVDQTTPRGTAVTASAANITSISATATTAADEIVVDFLACYQANAGSLTAGANQTQRWNTEATGGTGDPEGAGSSQAGSDGGVMSWTRTTNGYLGLIAFSVKPAAAASTTNSGILLLRSG